MITPLRVLCAIVLLACGLMPLTATAGPITYTSTFMASNGLPFTVPEATLQQACQYRELVAVRSRICSMSSTTRTSQ